MRTAAAALALALGLSGCTSDEPPAETTSEQRVTSASPADFAETEQY